MRMFAMEFMIECEQLDMKTFGAIDYEQAKEIAENYADEVFPDIDDIQVHVYEIKETSLD